MSTVIKPFKESFYTLTQLTKRNIKIFLSDKAGVFFSMLAPLIVLLLYVLFLGDVQVNSVMSFVPDSFALNENAVQAYVDCWMIAGVLSVSCITVSLGANSVMVLDKTRGILNDSLSSPVKRWVITASYFLYNFIVTVAITLVALGVCLIYLVISGGWYLTLADVLLTICTVILSSLSATLITVFLCGFFKTENALSAFSGIISSVIGFFIGAYMPMSIMPKALQYASGLFPGSHSAGIFRNYLMTGALENLGKDLPSEILEKLSEAFAMKVNFFGEAVGINFMYIFVAVSIVIFAALNFFFSFKKKARRK